MYVHVYICIFHHRRSVQSSLLIFRTNSGIIWHCFLVFITFVLAILHWRLLRMRKSLRFTPVKKEIDITGINSRVWTMPVVWFSLFRGEFAESYFLSVQEREYQNSLPSPFFFFHFVFSSSNKSGEKIFWVAVNSHLWFHPCHIPFIPSSRTYLSSLHSEISFSFVTVELQPQPLFSIRKQVVVCAQLLCCWSLDFWYNENTFCINSQLAHDAYWTAVAFPFFAPAKGNGRRLAMDFTVFCWF